MAQVTLQVVVNSAAVSNLEARINALDNRSITLNVNDGNLRTFNTRLQTGITRTNNLATAQQNLQTTLHQTSESWRDGTEQIRENSDALNQNRQRQHQNQRQQQQNRQQNRQQNEDLRQQGLLYDILGRSVTSFIARMAAYRAVYGAIRAITNGFTEALQTLKAVDDELVTVRKVTGFDAYQMADVESTAYEVASRYGANAADYVAGVANFARAGYKELSGDLAELAQKTQIVGDTTAEVANQFLLSVDAAYKYHGSVEQLNAVLDGANELDNKYATSIAKIAEGMGIVAPVAAQMHVGIDELAASIGTITAVTQRSGSETARALRALFLNIVGDTKTEIDEGVTWTTGEIEGLRDIIKVYAKDAYNAAQATGSIIDPMKAMEGLSKSLKDGLLSEQELMEMVSDIGGKLRTSQLLALINNWDMYESMLDDYRNAYGSADKEIENAMDSWTRKTNVLKNTWTQFVKTDLDSSLFKKLLDILTWIVERLDSLPAVLARIFMLMAAFHLDGIATGLGNIASSIKGLFTSLGGLGAVLAGISVAWGVVSFAIESHNRSIEEARKAAQEDIKATEADIKLLGDLKQRYLDIVDSTASAAEKTQQLTEFKKALVEQYGFEKEAVQQINLERQTGIDLLNQEMAASMRRTLSENQEIFNQAAEVYNGTTETESFWYYFGESLPIEEMERFGATLVSQEDGVSKVVVSGENLRETYENLSNVISVLEKKQLSRNGLTYEEEELLNDLRARYHELGTQMEEWGSIYENQIELQAKYNLLMEGVAGKVIDSKDAFDGLKRTLEATYGSNKEVWEVMNRLLNETFPQFSAAVEDTEGAVDDLNESVHSETDSWWANQQALEADADATKRLNAAKADAEAAARKLIPALFDEAGHLTAVGEMALGADSNLASLVNSILTMQNSVNQANYSNVIAQIAMMGDTASMSAVQLANMASVFGLDWNSTIAHDQLSGIIRTAQARGQSVQSVLLGWAQSYINQYTNFHTNATGAITPYVPASASGGHSSGGHSSGGSSGGRTSGSSSGSSSTTDARLVALRERVALLRSELELLRAQGASDDAIIGKIREIMAALQNQANYMTSIGESQTDINGLLTDYYNYQNEINELLEEEEDTTDSILERLRERQALLESELDLENVNGSNDRARIVTMQQIMDVLQQQIDHMREIGADQTDINQLCVEWWRYHNQISDLMEQEAQSATEQAEALERARNAQEALNNALRERNVHIYNAATGQWEWAANPSTVAAAQSELDEARAAIPMYSNPYGPGYKSSLFAPKGGTSIVNSGTKNYGATYNIGGINISEADAKSMSLYQLLQLSKSLGIYRRTS